MSSLYGSLKKNLKESPALNPEYSTRKSFYNKAHYSEDADGKTLRSYQTDIMRIKDGKIEMLCDEDALTQTTLRHVKEFLLQNGMEPLNKQQLIKLINEQKNITEAEDLEEADSQVVWSSETTEDDYDEEFLKEEYKDYVDMFVSPDDAKSFEDWKYDYIADDSSDMWNVKEDDLKTNIYPMIDEQINNDILIISGNYNSNYPDFRPSGSGGKFLNKVEDILDWLSNEDRIDFYVENGNLGVKAYDHDGSIGGLLYTLPDDKKVLLDLAKSTDYYNEDRSDEDILGELSYDLNHGYYDMSDFFKFSDKFVPIKWNL